MDTPMSQLIKTRFPSERKRLARSCPRQHQGVSPSGAAPPRTYNPAIKDVSVFCTVSVLNIWLCLEPSYTPSWPGKQDLEVKSNSTLINDCIIRVIKHSASTGQVSCAGFLKSVNYNYRHNLPQTWIIPCTQLTLM